MKNVVETQCFVLEVALALAEAESPKGVRNWFVYKGCTF